MKIIVYSAFILAGAGLQFTGLLLLNKSRKTLLQSIGWNNSFVRIAISLLTGILTPVCSSLYAFYTVQPETAPAMMTGFIIAAILFVLGLIALLHPFKMRRAFIKFEISIAFLMMVIFHVFSIEGKLNKWSGGVFVFFALYFLFLHFLKNRNSQKTHSRNNVLMGKKGFALLLFFVSVMIAVAGSLIVVYSSLKFSQSTGISFSVFSFIIIPIILLIPYFSSLLMAVKNDEDLNLEMERFLQGGLLSFLIVIGYVALANAVELTSIYYRFNNFILIGSFVLLTLFLIPLLKLSRFKGMVLVFIYLLFVVNSVLKIVC